MVDAQKHPKRVLTGAEGEDKFGNLKSCSVAALPPYLNFGFMVRVEGSWFKGLREVSVKGSGCGALE